MLSHRVQPLNAVICHSLAGAFRAMPRSAGPSPGCFATIAGPAMGEVALGHPTAGAHMGCRHECHERAGPGGA